MEIKILRFKFGLKAVSRGQGGGQYYKAEAEAKSFI